MLVVRTGDRRSAANEVRAAVAAVAPRVAIESTRSAEEYSMLGLLPQRVGASVTATLGLVGLLLAAIGVYGVTASAVARRRREIGIRMALGAQRRDIERLMIRPGLALAAVGVAIGAVGAALLSRLMSAVLFSVSATDALTYVSVSLLLIVVALTACYMPARRATKHDPLIALRTE
jgi:ABC-type antimicrobial peptide transport system permease subunit